MYMLELHVSYESYQLLLVNLHLEVLSTAMLRTRGDGMNSGIPKTAISRLSIINIKHLIT